MKPVPPVQEELLKIFSEQLIPWARRGVQPMVLARPPLSGPEGVGTVAVQTPLLKAQRQGHSSNVLARWPDKGLAALRIPHLGCVLDGEVDLRIGVTEEMYRENDKLDKRHGQAILTLPPRSWVLVPAGIPQSDGTRGHREPGRPPIRSIRILWVNVLPEGLILHTCHTQDGVHTPTAGLFVNGTGFTRMIELVSEEMESVSPHSPEIVRSLFMAFLLSVEKVIAEGSFLAVAIPEELSTVTSGSTDVKGTPGDQAVDRAVRYITTHLRKPLTVKKIAAQAYVSAPQLNRLFRARLNASVMRYVTERRIDAAASYLRGTELSIGEISDSLGFANRTYFSRVFLQETGFAPTEYRRQHRNRKVDFAGRKS